MGWHRPSASTLCGLVGPSFHLSALSNRCGFPRASMMSLAHRSSTGSAFEAWACSEVIALLPNSFALCPAEVLDGGLGFQGSRYSWRHACIFSSEKKLYSHLLVVWHSMKSLRALAETSFD